MDCDFWQKIQEEGGRKEIIFQTWYNSKSVWEDNYIVNFIGIYRKADLSEPKCKACLYIRVALQLRHL